MSDVTVGTNPTPGVFRRRYSVDMEQDTLTATDPAIGAALDTDDDLLEDELLVEEISIDGMCGVY